MAESTVYERQWPEAGVTRVPFWAYRDPQVYQREMERVCGGESWAYVGLSVEIPQAGDCKQVSIGERPLVMNRDVEGQIHVFENRCAHRLGVQFCRQPWGNAKTFTCPYHLWSYDIQGRLRGVPFQHGLKGQGGMPDDFARAEYGLTELRVSRKMACIKSSHAITMNVVCRWR